MDVESFFTVRCGLTNFPEDATVLKAIFLPSEHSVLKDGNLIDTTPGAVSLKCNNQREYIFFFSFFHISFDIIYLSAGTESSTIDASSGPLPVTSYDIITIKWLSEDPPKIR